MTAAFYVPDGDGYVAAEHTRGPWDPGAQHGGPPSALVAHALEQAYPSAGTQLVRITLEILRPVPIGPVAVATEVVRGGRRVELLGATLTAGGAPAVLARAWRIRTADVGLPPDPRPDRRRRSQVRGSPVHDACGDAVPPPDAGSELAFFPGLAEVGWHRAVEARFVEGAWNAIGPASVWFRLRVAVVAGHDPSPVERVLAAADAGNGVSAAVDFTRYVFVNTDLSVSLHRLPAGEWVHMAASTRAEPHGVGLATTRLSDERGPIGVGAQSLYVARRDS